MSFCFQPCCFSSQAWRRRASRQSPFLGAPILQVYRSLLPHARLSNEHYALKTFEVDHIRAEKHGGATSLANLCPSCFDCNRQKGSDLSSVDPMTDEVVPLFHPRRDVWDEHFRLTENGEVEAITGKGRVTVKLLDFNHPERVAIRAALMKLGRYPETK